MIISSYIYIPVNNLEKAASCSFTCIRNWYVNERFYAFYAPNYKENSCVTKWGKKAELVVFVRTTSRKCNFLQVL